MTAPKPRPRKKKGKISSSELADRRKAARQSRADALFIAYYNMGEGRSLQRLADMCFSIGNKISPKTLQKYSVDFNWQMKLLDAQKADEELRQKLREKEISELQQKELVIGQGMHGLAGAGLQYLTNRVDKREQKNLGRTLKLSPESIVRFAEAGSKIQRLALGEATDRQEIVVQLNNIWVANIMNIFLAINRLPTWEMREQEFTNRLDSLTDNILSEGVKI